MLFLAKPTDCLAHPVDILLAHPPSPKGGYEVSLSESTFPNLPEPTPSPPQLSFLSLDQVARPRRHSTAVLIQRAEDQVRRSSRATLQSRYTRLNVRLALGSGARAHVVERHLDLALLLAKPLGAGSKSEIHVGSISQHENVLSVLDVVNHEDQVMAITEFCTRDLLSSAQYTKPTSTQIISLMRQIICGVRYLHLRGIAHRDLKLENIYLSGETPKITGFGCALLSTACLTDAPDMNLSFTEERVGATPYLAPEIHGVEQYDAYLADIWALGIILVGLSTGRFPWTCTRSDPSFNRFKKDPTSYLKSLGLNEPELQLALLLLIPDPNLRTNSTTLIQSLDLTDPII